MRSRVLSAQSNVQGASGTSHVNRCPATEHQSAGRASTEATEPRSMLCGLSVLASLRRADDLGGGLGCRLLAGHRSPSTVQPPVSAGSAARSCRGSSVRFSVILCVHNGLSRGSSVRFSVILCRLGLLGDFAIEVGLSTPGEREKARPRLQVAGGRAGGHCHHTCASRLSAARGAAPARSRARRIGERNRGSQGTSSAGAYLIRSAFAFAAATSRVTSWSTAMAHTTRMQPLAAAAAAVRGIRIAPSIPPSLLVDAGR